jgi:hypothetical protein
VKLAGPLAGAAAKVAALEELNPRLFGGALVLAAVLLIASGLGGRKARDAGQGAQAQRRGPPG